MALDDHVVKIDFALSYYYRVVALADYILGLLDQPVLILFLHQFVDFAADNFDIQILQELAVKDRSLVQHLAALLLRVPLHGQHDCREPRSSGTESIAQLPLDGSWLVQYQIFGHQ